METVNVNIETPEIRVDVVQNEPPVVVVNVERQVIETVAAPVSRPVAIEARAGKNGERGERGEKGEKGDKGEPGKDGVNGADGQQGERGEKGERGDDGADGERGAQGIKGDTGERGEKGDKGEQGKEGKDGQRGRDGKDGAKGEKGDKGDTGERGEKGRDGKDGIGFPGPPGKQGPPGNSAPHTHPLSEIEQSGATDGQVPIWDDGAGEWVAGDAPGGGASIIEKTYAEMAAHIAADELTPGQWYNITDAAGTDLGFICLALTENEISVSGSGGYLNADFQSVGNYDGVAAETGTAAGTQLGIWRIGFEEITILYTNLAGGTFAVGETIMGGTSGATAVIITDDGAISMTAYMTSPGVGFDGSEQLDNGAGVTADMDGAAGTPTIVEGDIVIWNLIHWQLTDATVLDGTDPATNTAAYTELLKTVADVGYVAAWDISEYNFEADQIEYRSDLRGNVVRGNIGLVDFQWGNDLWTLNTLQSGAYIQQPNLRCEFRSCFLYSNGYIIESEAGDNVSFFGLVFFPGAGIQGCYFGESTQINTCELGPNAILSSIITGSSCTIENNILENGASMTGITAGAGCSISRNKIGQGATMGGSTTMGDGASMDDNVLEASAVLGGITGGNNIIIARNTLRANVQVGAGSTTMADGSAVRNNNFGISSEMLNFTLGTNSTIDGNITEASVTINDNTFGESCNFAGCYLGILSFINTNTFGDAVGWSARTETSVQISDNIFSSNVSFSAYFQAATGGMEFKNKTIEDDIFECRFGVTANVSETISLPIVQKRCENGFSNFDESFDLTGLTTLDWLAENNYVGIGNITSSNATEAIDTISNFPTAFPFLLRPAAGLTLTVTGTAIAGIGAGQIALTTANVVLDGTNGEWLELEADPGGGGFLREKSRSGTLL